MTYQFMFYGGLIGILITLPITIYLFTKLRIAHVIEDLTGFHLWGNNKRRLSRGYANTEGNLRETSSEIQIRRDHVASEVAHSAALEETELLYDEVGATTFLGNNKVEETTVLGAEETTLLHNPSEYSTNWFEIEEDIMIVHSSEKILEEGSH